MYFQPFASPMVCSHAETSKNPVPLDAGLGIVICPLYTGLVRSAQVSGLGIPFFWPSTVL